MIEKILTRLKILLLFMCACVYAEAQESMFTFTDAGKTITGLTEDGTAAESLTIPLAVTKVNSGAFQDGLNGTKKLKTLIVEDGGNPVFEGALFGKRSSTLTTIKTGSGMSSANIKALLTSLETGSSLKYLEMEGYTDADPDDDWTDMSAILTSSVTVRMPAALVANQVFGEAALEGRFYISKELISFCGNATFIDDDDGSNMLFYVATGIESGRIKIQRVQYIRKGRGVLIHRTASSEGTCYLPRYTGTIPTAVTTLYSQNMLVGVKSATDITATDGDYINLILSNGAFHPTSGGTLGANKAYLQVPTASLSSLSVEAPLMIDFDEETTGIGAALNDKGEMINDKWFTLQGVKLEGMPTEKGIYINGGRKVVIM